MLAEIAEVRRLQCIAAEAAAARAARISRAKNGYQEECESRRASAEESFGRAMSAPSLALEVSKLWSLDLLRHDEAAARAASEAAAASEAFGRSSAAWHAATMRHDFARSVLGDAVRREADKRDETALQDALDRHARQERQR
jgi:hypothetical protein